MLEEAYGTVVSMVVVDALWSVELEDARPMLICGELSMVDSFPLLYSWLAYDLFRLERRKIGFFSSYFSVLFCVRYWSFVPNHNLPCSPSREIFPIAIPIMTRFRLQRRVV